MERKRENWIDFVKSIAIFIVLMNHAGVQIKGVNFWGGMFYVAVFFVLSGYTYKCKEQSYLSYVRDKGRRLLVPYFVANLMMILFFAAKELMTTRALQTVSATGILGVFYARNQLFVSSHAANVQFYQYLNAPTWFLPALFLAICLFDGLVRMFRGNQKKVCICLLLLLIVQILYHNLCPILLPWSIDCLPYFAILLQAGYVAGKQELFDKICMRGKNGPYKGVALLLCILFIVCALFNGSANLSIAEYGKYVTLSLFNAVISSLLICLLAYALEHKTKAGIPTIFVRAGKYTLDILCYHLLVFFFLLGILPYAMLYAGISLHPYLLDLVKVIIILFTIELFIRIGENKRA